MPRRYGLGGGELIVTDPDPLEVALRQAQLEEMIQKPQLARAQLALQQMEQRRLGETAASQTELARTQLELDKQKAIEAGDIDRAKLLAEQSRIASENRYREGGLAEEIRYHKESTAGEKEKTRAGLVSDVMSHLGQREGVEGGGIPRGTTAAIAAKLGFPELGAGLGEATAGEARQKALALLPEYQKMTPEQRTTEMAALPEEQRNVLTGLLSQPAPGVTGPPTVAPTGTPTTESAGTRFGRYLKRISVPPEQRPDVVKRRQAIQQFWKDIYGGYRGQ